jgi:Zn-dependent peptidase ImmA (M78 family)
MSTLATGDAFEASAFAVIETELAAGRLGLEPKCSKMCRRPRYFSRDRNADIVFDFSIEISRPGASEYTFRWIFECKALGRRVSVDDVEEFSSKVGQVAGHSVKAIMVTTQGYQPAALAVAKAKGIALIRHFANDVQWILERTTRIPANWRGSQDVEAVRALTEDEYVGRKSEFHCYDGDEHTTSIAAVVLRALEKGIPSAKERAKVLAPDSTRRSVPFIAKPDIVRRADEVLAAVHYTDGLVPLDEIAAWQGRDAGLTVRRRVQAGAADAAYGVLGRICFSTLEIITYATADNLPQREAFTLAHELGHWFLGHGAYAQREYCAERDLEDEEESADEIRRMDWQANYFASCLLLPAASFVADFKKETRALDVTDRGFGPLFVDNQPTNQATYARITQALMARYGVSRQVVNIRLKTLDLLTDQRAMHGPRRIGT